MPFSEEPKNKLKKLVIGKCLKIITYGIDNFIKSGQNRIVGDIYCNGIFVQEILLKEGYVWHHPLEDRKKFDTWQLKARRGGLGIWSLPYAEKPWEWKSKQKRIPSYT
ncbi:staphylococcal-like nuclease CAN1 [Cannabis sativa]|uniref:staphylococcal-like nuclease CAN1 n=1 Tax=Cannabis sativa TaxID=3483 RepID=UPI0029C9F1EB|nr:staphylococcal-like nuclease CAN1 [Cannabis sativa]